MAPIASYQVTVAGLSVTFTDSSANLPTSWAWSFGDGTTSTSRHPVHTYTVEGIYNVVLTVANADGSDTEANQIIASTKAILYATIAQMVKGELNGLVTVDSNYFQHLVRKWQLFLQPGLPPHQAVSDADVFNELKWPSLVNVLISKLVIYDLILRAVRQAGVASSVSLPVNGGSSDGATTTVYDYAVDMSTVVLPIVGTSLRVDKITIDNKDIGPSPAFLDVYSFLNWLNSLQLAHFIMDGVFLKALGSANILTTFWYSIIAGASTTQTQTAFTASNPQVVVIGGGISGGASGGNTGLAKGPIKQIETGPSRVEWFDASDFWSTFFKSVGSGLSVADTRGAGGLFETLINDICGYGSRVQIKLPMCKLDVDSPLFIVSGPVIGRHVLTSNDMLGLPNLPLPPTMFMVQWVSVPTDPYPGLLTEDNYTYDHEAQVESPYNLLRFSLADHPAGQYVIIRWGDTFADLSVWDETGTFNVNLLIPGMQFPHKFNARGYRYIVSRQAVFNPDPTALVTIHQ